MRGRRGAMSVRTEREHEAAMDCESPLRPRRTGRRGTRVQALAACGTLLLAAAAAFAPAHAEPYLAVENGMHCRNCHTDPAGGGKRTVFGTTFARTQLSERILLPTEGSGWNGEVHERVGLGGDLRGGYSDVDVPGAAVASETEVTQGTLYAEFRAVPDTLSFYFDRKLAPGASENREAYALITPGSNTFRVKVGQFFLPFGLRLEDDSTFVRQRSGINFNTPDDGVELSVELPQWSVQAALSNGTAGAGSVSGRQQTSLSAAYVQSRWRLGASYNLNEDDRGDREMQALFAGWTTGPISWLAELDFITDARPGQPDRDIYASLLEGNLRVAKAHNVKLSYDFVDPSGTDDERERYSLVWEYTPFQMFQSRVGLRRYNGVSGIPLSNRDEVFLELHAYF